MVVSPWLTVSVSFVGVILIPVIALLWRIAVSITRDRDQITGIQEDLHNLIADKDKVHKEMYEQMREDRNATNTRLRWLEENLWNNRRTRGQP